MKLLYLLLIISSGLFYSCSTQKIPSKEKSETKMTFEPNDEGEYDIIVLDPQYDIYLKTIAHPMSFYSENYYQTKNRFYVSTWNQRHMNPFRYNPNIYAVSIDLDPSINYGLEFEYKLYNFFKFMEWKYKIRFT